MHDDFPLGPTGEFPDGKVHPTDDGEIRIAIGNDQGNVVIDFGTPVAWLAVRPNQARQLAVSLIKQANVVDGRGPLIEFHEGT